MDPVEIDSPGELREVLYKSPRSVLEMIHEMGGPEKILSTPKHKFKNLPIGFIQELYVAALGCIGSRMPNLEPYISIDVDRIPDINIACIDPSNEEIAVQSLAEVTIYTPHSRKKNESLKDIISKKLAKRYPDKTSIFVLVADSQEVKLDIDGLGKLVAENNTQDYQVILLHKTRTSSLEGVIPLGPDASGLIDAKKFTDPKRLESYRDDNEVSKWKDLKNPHIFWILNKAQKLADGRHIVPAGVFDPSPDGVKRNSKDSLILLEHPDHRIVALAEEQDIDKIENNLQNKCGD